MKGAMSSLKDVRDFLSRKRIAVVGVSRNPKDFTRTLWAEFRRRGYDVVPVNPAVSEVDGLECYARLQDISPVVDAALLLTKPPVTDRVVRECAEAGVGCVWMYRATGAGAVSPNAVAFCKSQGIRVISGECPFMFFPGTAWPHRFHGSLAKLFGKYPE
jgi:uncharacterized protein